MSTLQVHAIPRSRLAAMLENGRDDLDNPIEPWSVGGGEPLRRRLRLAEPGDDVALVAYRPFPAPSHWSEIGPVFVHRTGLRGAHRRRRLRPCPEEGEVRARLETSRSRSPDVEE